MVNCEFFPQKRHFQTQLSVMISWGGKGAGRAGIRMGPNYSGDVWEQLEPIGNKPSEYHGQL